MQRNTNTTAVNLYVVVEKNGRSGTFATHPFSPRRCFAFVSYVRQALGPWIKCLQAWARQPAAQEQGPWATITQPAAALLSGIEDHQPAPARKNTRHSSEPPALAAHKALTVILFRVMLLGDEVQGSPHRAPSTAAWAAARAYLLMLSLPGAGAYGILQPAALGIVLTNLRSWCRNSSVHRPGGGAAQAGSGDAAVLAEGGGNKKGPKKRRRGIEASGGSDDDGGGDSEGEGGRRGGGGRNGRRAGGGGGGGSGSDGEVQACLVLVKACLACVPLGSHQVRVF